MGPYRSLFVLMSFNGSLQVLMRLLVCLSVLISLYAILFVVKGFIGPDALSWVLMGPYKS